MSGFMAVASWIASAKALSWSIGSPSDWIVIFCSILVSTTPSRSVLYYAKIASYKLRNPERRPYRDGLNRARLGTDGLRAHDLPGGFVGAVLGFQVDLARFCGHHGHLVGGGAVDCRIRTVHHAFGVDYPSRNSLLGRNRSLHSGENLKRPPPVLLDYFS